MSVSIGERPVIFGGDDGRYTQRGAEDAELYANTAVGNPQVEQSYLSGDSSGFDPAIHEADEQRVRAFRLQRDGSIAVGGFGIESPRRRAVMRSIGFAIGPTLPLIVRGRMSNN